MTTVEHDHDHDAHLPGAVHAMVLFGDSSLYVSHMPLFSAPHNDQVILEVALSKDGEDPAQRYRQDRAATQTPYYSVKPPSMHLSVLEEGSSFVGDVHRVSYEDDGERIDSGVTVTVRRVVYTQKLDPNTRADEGRHYVCFGHDGEFFAVHQINAAPSFDQIIAADITDQNVIGEAGSAAMLVTLPGADVADSRWSAGETAEAKVRVRPGTRGERVLSAEVTAGTEVFFDDRFLQG